MIRIVVCLSLLAASVLLYQCTSEKAPKPETNQNTKLCPESPSFQSRILPVFQASCATSGCHDQNTRGGGYVFEQYQEIKDGVMNGEVLCAIKHGSGCSPMPKGGDKLPDSTICAIENWAANGAPDN